MTTDTAASLSDPLYAPGQDALLSWLEQEAIDALATAMAGWAPALPWFDIEAMILDANDGAPASWFTPPYEVPDDGARGPVLAGSDDADILHGGEAADLLFGLEGDDMLQDVRGNNLFDGGAGDDIIEGAGQSLYIGGAGDDTITAWGADITLAFNAGDGVDTVVLCARGPATISLGQGIDAAGVTVLRDGAALVVKTGAAEGMWLAGWYDNPAPEALWLQLIGEAGTESWDLMALAGGFSDRQAAPLGADGWQGAAPSGGELAATYAADPAGIEITGASAALWLDAFGAIAAPGVLL